MSFIITLHVQEGIVMASDSRITYNSAYSSNKDSGKSPFDDSIALTDASYKTFRAGNSIGLSMFGMANIKGVAMRAYVEDFISECIVADKTDIEEVPGLLVDYFNHMSDVPETGFHVAGFHTHGNQRSMRAWRVYVASKKITPIVPQQQRRGAIWDGEQDILARLFHKELHIKNPGAEYTPIETYRIPFEMFTLQDAIDFAVYAIRITADTMRFQLRPNTVGGAINVLVIKQNESFWVQQSL